MLDFKPLALSLRGEYTRCYLAAQERASDYSFINLWGWHDDRRYETAFCDGLFWLRLTAENPPKLWAPVGDWTGRDWKEILGRLFPEGAVFERVPERLAQILQEDLGGMIEVSDQRSEWEYLYDAGELTELAGNRFHKKKNLLHQFMKYGPVYEPISSENIGEVRMFQCEWCRQRCAADESGGLAAENAAIMRVLADWERMPGITGGALRIDGKIAAYTIAEDIGDGTVVIHFEKGLDYKGVYQGINQIFLKENAGAFRLVNREQDMGIEGLKKAKLSYNPVDFLRKSVVTWRP